jgi:hypothetical protein
VPFSDEDDDIDDDDDDDDKDNVIKRSIPASYPGRPRFRPCPRVLLSWALFPMSLFNSSRIMPRFFIKFGHGRFLLHLITLIIDQLLYHSTVRTLSYRQRR